MSGGDPRDDDADLGSDPEASRLEASGEDLRSGCAVVGLGASAGGLEALEDFFEHTPADSGLAFVVVTHQHAGQASMLPELLGRHTRIPIALVSQRSVLEPNHVYLPEPGKQLSVLGGALIAVDPEPRPAVHLPIDHFFKSLALDRRERAIGVVLSGTGSDGTLGIKEIKGALGLTLAQEAKSARYGAMPQSAIASDMVDLVLSPAEMPQRIVNYARGLAGGASMSALGPDQQAVPVLGELLVTLRDRTGHDFSLYKRSTVLRRIERRMHIHHLVTLAQYLRYLQQTPAEASLLFQELLIGVTSFFRDAEAWDALGAAIRSLMQQRPEGHTLRAWVPACSTGEEAYSLAIVMHECAQELGRPPAYQIFGTNLEPRAIEVARAGTYPLGIAADVTPERLARHFEPHEDAYTIRKEIREKLVFAPQDVLTDPPFTKLDLLSCRNLLIYLDAQLQQRLLTMFHYALRPDGILFLGGSESLGAASRLFSTLDMHSKVYGRLQVPEGSYRAEVPIRFGDRIPPTARKMVDVRAEHAVERLLVSELVPPTVLVRERGDLVHVHGRTGQFLEPAPGLQLGANIFDMVRGGLGAELGNAMRSAATEPSAEVVRHRVMVKTNGDVARVDLRVRRVLQPEKFRGMFLVSFEQSSQEPPVSEAPGDSKETPARVLALQHELRHSQESHQGTIEELEATNEELQSANEEMQSTNEELQSTNEELETSREELQSLNEELQTVNSELQRKVEELSLARDDLNNLLNGTEIATVFLDTNLRIKRYTERAKRVIPLIPSDVGRPLGDIVARLHYDLLLKDATEVLETLVFKEVEVPSDGDVYYLLRILPYRTNENLIDGLVLTFIDISKLKALQQRERRLARAIEDSPTTVATQDRDLRYTWASGPLFGKLPDEVTGRSDPELLGSEAAARLVELKRSTLESGAARRTRVVCRQGDDQVAYDLHVRADREPHGAISGVSSVCTMLAVPE